MINQKTEHIGNYQLVEYMGREGRGRLYKVRSAAHYPVSDNHNGFSALKIFPPVPDDSAVCARFKEQAEALMGSSCTHVTRCLDAFAWPAGKKAVRPCLVLEWPGKNRLSDLMQDHSGPLPQEKAAEIFRQVLEALIGAGRAPIRIKYLHPSQIILDDRGEVRLSGFSLSCFEEKMGASLSGGEHFFDYIAPEFSGAETFGDDVSLVYSFGVCFYQALTGSLPYPLLEDMTGEGDCFGSAAAAYVNRWREPGPLRPDLDSTHFQKWPATRSFLEKCLQPRRDFRLQNFSELGAAFETVLLELAAPPKPKLVPMAAKPDRAEPPKPAARRATPVFKIRIPRLAWAALAAGAALMLGLGLLTRNRPAAPAIPLAQDSIELRASPEGAPATADRSLPETVSVEIAFNMIPPPSDEPPIRIAFRTANQEEWKPAPDPFHAAPGVLQLRFERADHVALEKSVEVPHGVKSFLVNGPRYSDWRPGEPLQQLLKMESAWQRQDLDNLAAAMAEAPSGLLSWPAYRARWNQIQESWSADVKAKSEAKSYETCVVEVVLDPETPASAPVSISICQKSGARWIPVKGSFRLRPGEYVLSFVRPDYERFLMPITVVDDRERQQILGPRATDWKPGPLLQELVVLEQAWADGNLETLTRRFAMPWLGNLESEEHRNRLSRLREEWYAKLIEQP